MAKAAAVIRGNGVCPDIVESMFKVAGAAKSSKVVVTCDAGAACCEKNGGNLLIPYF